MNITITANGTSRTADMIPGTMYVRETPADTAGELTLRCRQSEAAEGSFSVYLSPTFTAADALALVQTCGEGTASIGAPVNAGHALLNITIKPAPPRAEITWTGLTSNQ